MELQNILLTTDFSECSEHAFAPTADLARHFKAAIDLVHVSDFPPPPGAEIVGVSVTEYNARLRSRLEELAHASVFQGVEVGVRLLEGYGIEALKEYQGDRGHHLAAVATHGHSGLKHLLLGSFAEKVVRHLACPVLTFRGGEDLQDFSIKKILVPYDFSESAAAALDAIRFFAGEFGAQVHLIHVLYRDLIPVAGFPTEVGFGASVSRFWQEAESAVLRGLKEYAERELPGLQVEVGTAVGSPVHEIVAKAREIECDLVIMATHGHTGLGHALVGGVAERVVRKAPCSILTIRPTEAK